MNIVALFETTWHHTERNRYAKIDTVEQISQHYIDTKYTIGLKMNHILLDWYETGAKINGKEKKNDGKRKWEQRVQQFCCEIPLNQNWI